MQFGDKKPLGIIIVKSLIFKTYSCEYSPTWRLVLKKSTTNSKGILLTVQGSFGGIFIFFSHNILNISIILIIRFSLSSNQHNLKSYAIIFGQSSVSNNVNVFISPNCIHIIGGE